LPWLQDLQPQEVGQRLGVVLMGKRVVGPSPPEPNWDRLDLRGINSTRNAWGYLAPDDSAIVSDDGKVFIRVEKDMLDKPKSSKGVIVRLMSNQWAVLKRCLRWSKIIKELYDFEQEIDEESVEIDIPSSNNGQSLKLTPPERKRKLSIRRSK
jgi:hypothetical protein